MIPYSARIHRHLRIHGVVFPWMASVLVFGLLGCKDVTGGQQLPAGVQDPGTFNTPAGAVGMRVAALQAIENAIPSYIVNTGLLTDELTSNQTGASAGFILGLGNLPSSGSLDERILPEPSYGEDGTSADQVYGALQKVRGLVTQAAGALVTYDTGTFQQGDPVSLRSELYAFKGYAEILLAEFFCNGVPLSTLEYQKDFTYHAGVPNDSVYWHAIHTLDTAVMLAQVHDSIGLRNLALVLLGRTYLDLGRYAAAADDVTTIPDGFTYAEPVSWLDHNGSCLSDPRGCYTGLGNIINDVATLSNGEGVNGLPFLSSGDPRSRAVVTGPIGISQSLFVDQTFPVKYSSGLSTTFAPFPVADWIEARLIQAEAALHQNANDPKWLTILNTLRTTAPIPGTTQPATILQLPALTDPGPSSNGAGRVSLLFQERAYWLFLTGHRQGDLRRLIRNYGRDQKTVYPVGPYAAPGNGVYGTDVTAPIPGAEYANPLFQGCLNRSA